jgi:hypothetical protein
MKKNPSMYCVVTESLFHSRHVAYMYDYLSASGLCTRQHIQLLQGEWDGVLLDRGWDCEAHAVGAD